MVTDDDLLKMTIRTYAYLRRYNEAPSSNDEIMTVKNKGFGTILGVLDEKDGISQGDIAKLAKLRQQSVSEALVNLEKRGYIRREHSDKDKRVSLIFITDEGRIAQRELSFSRNKMASRFFASLTDEEKETLYQILMKLERDCAE